jgi:hypothetical protein
MLGFPIIPIFFEEMLNAFIIFMGIGNVVFNMAALAHFNLLSLGSIFTMTFQVQLLQLVFFCSLLFTKKGEHGALKCRLGRFYYLWTTAMTVIFWMIYASEGPVLIPLLAPWWLTISEHLIPFILVLALSCFTKVNIVNCKKHKIPFDFLLCISFYYLVLFVRYDFTGNPTYFILKSTFDSKLLLPMCVLLFVLKGAELWKARHRKNLKKKKEQRQLSNINNKTNE